MDLLQGLKSDYLVPCVESWPMGSLGSNLHKHIQIDKREKHFFELLWSVLLALYPVAVIVPQQHKLIEFDTIRIHGPPCRRACVVEVADSW